MVCLQEEGVTKVAVQDYINTATSATKTYIHLSPSKSIDTIFREVSRDFGHNVEDMVLVFQSREGRIISLNQYKDKTVQEVGITSDETDKATIFINRPQSKSSSLCLQELTEDDLLLGASASPTAGDLPTSGCDLPLTIMNSDYESHNYPSSSHAQLTSVVVESSNYVGLVNQAMTCYLNSLLQALYMTPEFRNALYNWEFDGVNETRSIPYQLQRLFLNLQTSSKVAVETTDLTTSFGWQGSDAWHQHDIQELCRVMFDALEHKFKDTKQANLINDLYEGKMLDYVKCLECGTEKSREDTFLDIPLPVRPFGSAVAYNSVEEALRAFVQPETLDGNNQYNCEKCDKKCDAHKGLKFIKFPYLLTLHLKRFDFDYNTMHRIKLNDKVVFPEVLNLNSFVPVSKTDSEPMEEKETTVKCDDSCTTDSGSADDESCQGTDISSTANGQDDNCADSDEGIDVSSGNNHNEIEAKGPYVYELFSIMIHSGSASGGHYYAYIKDFDKNQWFCFNDQSVTTITEDDIRKTYGGGPQRGYYSGAYSSSTNAYMLMYRQIDKDRNCRAMTVDNFPAHIKRLLDEMRRREEEDRINKEKENDMMKMSVYYRNPRTDAPQYAKISVFSNSTLAEAAQCAHQRFKLDGVIPPEDCRLVVYNKRHDCVHASPNSDETALVEVDMIYSDWFLEVRQTGEPWKKYKTGGINMRVYPINLEAEEVEEPTLVRVDVDMTVLELKQELGKLLNLDPQKLTVVMEMYSNKPKYLSNDEEIVKFDQNCTDYRLYVADTFEYVKLKKIIEHYGYTICLHLVLPDTDAVTLESLSIPSLDFNQNLDKLELSSGDRGTNSPSFRVSPQPGDGFGDQSNSEDSSLSDSDRTLVGDAPGDCMGLLSSSSTSPADQHMASPTDPCEDTYNYDVLGNPGEEMHWDDDETQQEAQKPADYFFKVASIYTPDPLSLDNCLRCCRVLADKRMTLERFKKHLEGVLRVPAEYFKVFRKYQNSEEEWACLSDTLRSAKDGDRLALKLGRVLRKDEYNCKVYHLKPDCLDPSIYLFDHIVAKGQTVTSVKKEILIQAKKQHMLDIPYNKCRLREKSWKKPRKVYLDDQKFAEDIMISSLSSFDVYLQELRDVDAVTSGNQLVLFVRRWHPSSLTLGPFQEVVLESTRVDELKAKVSEASGVPLENVELAHLKISFPCDMHLLDVHTELQWHQQVTNLEQWPLNVDDGSTFFYRDSTEALKELTAEEKKDLSQKENIRLGRLSIKSYSPGRERALKIYLDPSPSKSEDCLD